jgi:hypothetical protein
MFGVSDNLLESMLYRLSPKPGQSDTGNSINPLLKEKKFEKIVDFFNFEKLFDRVSDMLGS